jgi:hypothetical protein
VHVVGTEPRLAGWGPSLSSIDVPNLTAVVAASQGCMVQYIIKRGTDVIGVHDALKARTGTFIFTGLWEGKKKVRRRQLLVTLLILLRSRAA